MSSSITLTGLKENIEHKLLVQILSQARVELKKFGFKEALQNKGISLHLAIFTEDLLDKLIHGKKVLESRFSKNMISPYNKISKGDLVFVKRSGGSIMACFQAGEVLSYNNLTSAKINELKELFSDRLGLDKTDIFWTQKTVAKFATVIEIKNVVKLPAIKVDKKDRLGWCVLRYRDELKLF